MGTKTESLLKEAIHTLRIGNNDRAKLILNKISKKATNNVNIIFQLGIEYAKKNELNSALTVFQSLLSINKNDERIFYNIGLIYSLQNRVEEAICAYDSALNIQPNDAMVLINLSSIYCTVKEYNKALDCANKAINLDPNLAEAWHNRGIALNNLQEISKSIESYNNAINLNQNYYQAWSNISLPLLKEGRFLEAIKACDNALIIMPNYEQAWFNKGNSLYELRRFDEAIQCFDAAIRFRPNFSEAWSNKGSSYSELKKFREAIIHFDHALGLDKEFAQTWFNKALTLSELKQYDQVIICLKKAVQLNPYLDWAFGELLHAKMKVCDWVDLENSFDTVFDEILKEKRIIHPFQMLGLTDDIKLHKKASKIFSKKFEPNNALGVIPRHSIGHRIKLAYFSSDFYNHPTSYLINELIELHDRSKFEIIAFSFSPNVRDEMQLKLQEAFDQFIEVGNKSDIEVAQLSRDLSIDIAIDLKGFTQDSRPRIFSYRAAPIQVNYLGYPATMGTNYIDYIIADRELILSQFELQYSEKIVFLPFSYQPNDRRREISKTQFIRCELGLPSDAFVFCCFNNNYKILPSIFDGWMRILREVENSVLWLLEDNKWASENLKKEALLRGVSDKRLIFANRIKLSEHLARHHCADLFLDTFPYNAHTTSSDALWTGLPVLTLRGQSFASRVTSSLLNALDLPELIANSYQEYVALAIHFASDPKKLAEVKSKLIAKRLNSPLFNTPQFANSIESAYSAMFERYQAGLRPDHLFFTH